MENLLWIITGGLLMSGVAMVGGFTVILRPKILERLLLPLVSLAAGTLLGGAIFHMMPEGMESLDSLRSGAFLVGGFMTFFGLEQFLHWHHCHRSTCEDHKPVTYLILIGDGVHNFLGGLGIASTFLIDHRAGIVAWLAAAVHEIPQELGDFGVLVHSGWSRCRALFWNVMSALTFPVGALLAYFAAQQFEVSGLVLFGAGNFIYIAASDLVPEIKSEKSLSSAMANFFSLAAGVILMFLLAYFFRH